MVYNFITSLGDYFYTALTSAMIEIAWLKFLIYLVYDPLTFQLGEVFRSIITSIVENDTFRSFLFR